jgi:hypothetical protein
MLKFKLWKAVAVLAVLVAGAGRGEAASYNLADLLAGGSFISGDKLFSNFHNFTETGSKAPLGEANIYLTPISQPNRNLTDPGNWPLPPGQPACGEPCATEYGFRLSGDWDLVQNEDYNLGLDYTVTALTDCEIYANEIEITGNASNAEIDVSEGVTSGPLTLAIKGARIHDPGLDQLIDRQYFTSSLTGLPICVKSADVSMGIQLKTLDVLGSQASLEHVDVFYAQAIPEPSTYALLLLGSAGVGLMVRRKRS